MLDKKYKVSSASAIDNGKWVFVFDQEFLFFMAMDALYYFVQQGRLHVFCTILERFSCKKCITVTL